MLLSAPFLPPPLPNESDALNYRGGWTDDGCIVIKHETDIGVDAATNTITKVKFFSVCMHLGSMAALKVNDRVFRKGELGAAGSIYGEPNRLHFEIVCDDENVEKLTGRKTPFTPTDGRSDVVFGSLWFQIPEDEADENPEFTPRSVDLAFGQAFEQLEGAEGQPTRLHLPKSGGNFRYLELVARLTVAGALEADVAQNDILDALIRIEPVQPHPFSL